MFLALYGVPPLGERQSVTASERVHAPLSDALTRANRLKLKAGPNDALTADLCPGRDLFLAPVLKAGLEDVAEPRAQAEAPHAAEQLPAAAVPGARRAGSLAPNRSAGQGVSREGQLVQVAAEEL